MKKKCLVIIPGIPYPPVDGHKLKIYNVIQILSRHFDLNIVSISRENLEGSQKEFIAKYSYSHKHFLITRTDMFYSFFRGIVSKKPFQVLMFSLNRVKRYLRNDIGKIDYVFFNLIRTAEYIDIFPEEIKILDMVDVLSKSYERSGKTTTSLLHKLIYSVEGKRLRFYEKKSTDAVNLTTCVNKDEAQILKQYGSTKWIPNGVNCDLFDYKKKDNSVKNSIAFFGTMFYQPNIDAVIWFEKEVLPKINPSINLYIIGARPSKAIREIAKRRRNVIVTGFLEDPYIILNSCFAIIAPMQNGGGIQNKIIEAMGMAKINIVTNYAAAPIVGAENNIHLLIEDDPIKMAEKVNNVYKDPNSYHFIGENAKELVVSKFTWDAHGSELLNEINKLG